jgi:hypothetical protein
LEWLKAISVLLPVLLALTGAGCYLFNWYIEPDFSYGQFYTSAWIDYGVNQNTVHIEFKPDQHGAAYLATGEALTRLYDKAWINSKIDGKPVVLIIYMRDKTQLVETGKMLITAKEVGIILQGTPEERRSVIAVVNDRSEVTYNRSAVMIEEDGVIKYVQFNGTEMTPDAVYKSLLESSRGDFSARRS